MSEAAHWIRLSSAPEAARSAAYEIRGSLCLTTLGVFAEWAGTLGFPGYFGYNWDAFEDCMFTVARPGPRGPDGEPRAPLTIVVRDAAGLLADEPPRQLATLLDVLSDVAGRCSVRRPSSPVRDPRLLLLLHDSPAHLDELARRMEQAGFTVPGPDSWDLPR
ncbi:barstar family protein [Streptomyces sp. MMG1533]|uniref:barstar family protein n=1 Tax=Streptomyces sp. MMG1533 TaxID=1415546 RepID=UPI0006AFEC4A|nr:barstar family protein [Streptomyces sp. MMG1533]